MKEEGILKELIEGYRQSVSKRYQYQNIKDRFELPESINKETVDQLRHYFINYVYPEYKMREELNEAFKSLDDYIKHPQKLLIITMDATRLVFRYGIHLPKILSAALKAMRTFKAATDFENNLVTEAIKNKIEPPYTIKKVDSLIKFLSRKEIDDFIEISESLFEILHDRPLIKKIKEVIKYLIKVMEKKEETYTPSQIKGLEIGLEMIMEGDKLFTQLSTEDQQNFVNLITDIEKDNLDTIFKS
jgi:Lhr-like helicase